MTGEGSSCKDSEHIPYSSSTPGDFAPRNCLFGALNSFLSQTLF